jgi:predicted peptidase
MIRTEYRDSNWKFSFVAYTPENPEGKLPLVIQLHGAGERGNGQDQLDLVEVHGLSHLVKEKNYNCIIIMPQCPKDTFWAARVESIIDFIEQLKEAYPVDTSRIYLTGLSMGGFGTWFTAMARPDLFAAIAPVCGGGMAWNARVLTMPVWAFHGTEDAAVCVRHTDEMVNALQAAGRDVTYTRMDGVGHNVWVHAYNDSLMQWLLSHRKKD